MCDTWFVFYSPGARPRFFLQKIERYRSIFLRLRAKFGHRQPLF